MKISKTKNWFAKKTLKTVLTSLTQLNFDIHFTSSKLLLWLLLV